MVMIGQLNGSKDEEENKPHKKMGWRGCCALAAFFAVTFVVIFFACPAGIEHLDSVNFI